MEKIYSKFVKDRRKEFQIETAMWNDNGKKLVSKRNLLPEGKKHIENMMETYNMYSATGLLCGAQMAEDKIVFEYVLGDTFENLLLNALKEKNKEKTLKLIEEYNGIANQVSSGENAVFDLTFDNIIFDGAKYKIIDYEWSFPVVIEKEFIIFRAIYAFLLKYNGFVKELFNEQEFFNLFNVSLENKDKYLEYNNKFIEYVYGEQGYNTILKKYEKKSFDLFNDQAMHLVKSVQKRIEGKEDTYESKFFDKMQEDIEKHKEFYDDHTKFYKVTKKVREVLPYGYTDTKEFCEEFSAYLQDMYNMVEYYKNESNEREKMILQGQIREQELAQEIESILNRNIFRRIKRKLFK